MRDDQKRKLPPQLFTVLLALVVAIDLGVTWVFPDADPPLLFSQDHALSIDGYWYLAEARGWIEGTDPGVGENYRRPMVSFPAYVFYRLGGVGVATSRALSSLASVATLLLLAGLLRRRYGQTAALLGVLILAIHPAWHAFVRSPVIYPWVSFWLLAIVALASGRRPWRWFAAGGLLAVTVLTLKSILLVAAPALLWDGWQRYRERVRGRGLMVLSLPWIVVGVAALAAGPWSLPAFWGKVSQYYSDGGGSLFARFISFEERSRLFSALPAILPLAWVSCLLFLTHALPGRHPGRRLERLVHITVWGSVAAFTVFGYSPLRYLSILFPLMIFLAVSSIEAASRLHRLRRLPLRGPRGGFALAVGLIGTPYLIREEISAVLGSPLPGTALALGGVGILIICGVGYPWLRPGFRRLSVPALAFVLLPLVLMPRLLPMVEKPAYSLTTAGRELSTILLPTSRLAGPYAHALSVDSHLSAQRIRSMAYGEGRLKDRMESMGATHLICDEPPNVAAFEHVFARDGVALQRVETFQVRGKRVLLYRLSTAQGPASAFEDAVFFLAAGDADRAEPLLHTVLKSNFGSAAAWCSLGNLHLSRGELAGAYRCFIFAVESDPNRVAAHLALAQLYARKNFGPEVLHHLTKALEADPENDDLRGRVESVKAKLGAREE